MSYKNFIPTAWSEAITRELERAAVFAEDCNRQYEGDVKKTGDSVRILGVGKPTITKTSDKNIALSEPEAVEDTSILLPVEQIAYFNYKVDDIDKRQAIDGVMDALSKETSEGLANIMDQYIAELANLKEAVKLNSSAVQVTAQNVLQTIDSALKKLYENDVAPNAKIIITVTPRFYFLLKEAYTALDTDNSKILENGNIGRYGNVIVKMSNNVAHSADKTQDLIMLRTDRAIAFVNPIIHTEAYRPEKSFSDAVKGFALYDAKIVRPKELIVINAKY